MMKLNVLVFYYKSFAGVIIYIISKMPAHILRGKKKNKRVKRQKRLQIQQDIYRERLKRSPYCSI